MAAISAGAFTASGASAGRATTYLTISNLTGSPDELLSARSPVSSRVVLTRQAAAAGSGPALPGLAIPAHGTVTLSPFGDDVVFLHPAPLQVGQLVPLTLTFRQAGRVTVEATVTPPGAP
jgi:copper(I)-binding protein